MTSVVAAMALWVTDVVANSPWRGCEVVCVFYQCNCVSIIWLDDKLHLAHSHHLSITSSPKSIQLDGWWQLGADAGSHSPVHSHNGPWHVWGPRSPLHSWCFQEAGWVACRLPATVLVAVCLRSLKGKNVFPHNMAVWGLTPTLSGPGSCSRC